MSAREKLCLIGLLELLRPKKSLEFGFHRGGATSWMAKFSDSVITVDVNDYVDDAAKSFSECDIMEFHYRGGSGADQETEAFLRPFNNRR
jgi:predicted O-methyltransferase YrrM